MSSNTTLLETAKTIEDTGWVLMGIYVIGNLIYYVGALLSLLWRFIC